MSNYPVELNYEAKKAALEWLHEVGEHETMLRCPLTDWPEKTYRLAVLIQCAIETASESKYNRGLQRAIELTELAAKFHTLPVSEMLINLGARFKMELRQ